MTRSSARRTSYRTALVTGASSGIGRALAIALARRGTRVIAAARRSQALNALAAEMSLEGAIVEPLVLDCIDGDATWASVRRLDDRHELDLVVANAGVSGAGADGAWPNSSRVLATNLGGAIATLSAALPGMRARRRGHLAAMVSLAGMPRFGGGFVATGIVSPIYAATKVGLLAYLDGLRGDLSSEGIHVTALCPGFVRTEMTAQLETMPFALDPDLAAAEILWALDRGLGVHAFPRVTARLVRLFGARGVALAVALDRRARRTPASKRRPHA